MFCLSICFVSFLFLFVSGLTVFLCGAYLALNALVYFVEWEIITLNSGSVVITFLFDWISLSFTGFVFYLFFVYYV